MIKKTKIEPIIIPTKSQEEIEQVNAEKNQKLAENKAVQEAYNRSKQTTRDGVPIVDHNLPGNLLESQNNWLQSNSAFDEKHPKNTQEPTNPKSSSLESKAKPNTPSTSIRISVNLDPELHQKCTNMASNLRLSVAALTRIALIQFLKNNQ